MDAIICYMSQSNPSRDDRSEDHPTSTDSVEAFVTDLAQLRQGRTYQHLSRQTGIAHGTIHGAMTKTTRLPSENIIEHIVRALDRAHADQWLSRRAALADRIRAEAAAAADAAREPGLSVPGPPAEVTFPKQPDESAVEPPGLGPALLDEGAAVTLPEPGHPRARARSLRLVALMLFSMICGGLLAAPEPVYGTQVSIASYCEQHYPRTSGPAAYDRVDDSWAGWRCVTTDNVRVVIDIDAACREQHPVVLGVLGGAQFARHEQGFTSWSCWGSLVHLP